MMVFLPFSCSLISMGIAMEYVKVDLGMLFAANPHPKVTYTFSRFQRKISYEKYSSSRVQNLDDSENL